MDKNKTKYNVFLTRLQEELMTAATQHAVAWRFGTWSARERLLTVHERLPVSYTHLTLPTILLV